MTRKLLHCFTMLFILLLLMGCSTIQTTLVPGSFALLNGGGELGNYRFEKYSFPLVQILEQRGWRETDYISAELLIKLRVEQREMSRGWTWKPVYSPVSRTTTWVHPRKKSSFLVLTLTVLEGESYRNSGKEVIIREKKRSLPFSGEQEDWDETYLGLLQEYSFLF